MLTGPRALERTFQAEARQALPERLLRRMRRALADGAEGLFTGRLADDLRHAAEGFDLRLLGRAVLERTIAQAMRDPRQGEATLARAIDGVLRCEVARFRRTLDADLAQHSPGDRRTLIERLDDATGLVRFTELAAGLSGDRPSVVERSGRVTLGIDDDLPRTNS